MEPYVVKEGGSVDSIAAAYSVSEEDVIVVLLIYRRCITMILTDLGRPDCRRQFSWIYYHLGGAYGDNKNIRI